MGVEVHYQEGFINTSIRQDVYDFYSSLAALPTVFHPLVDNNVVSNEVETARFLLFTTVFHVQPIREVEGLLLQGRSLGI
jgi:hypothetical protein